MGIKNAVRFDMSTSRGRRIIAIFLAITVIVISIAMIGNMFISKKLEKAGDKYVENVKEIRFQQICAAIGQLNYASNRNANEVANVIRKDIREKYSDLSVLEKDLNQGKFDELSNLISNSIIQKSQQYLNNIPSAGNSIVVGTSSRILYNTDYTLSLSKQGTDKYETWEQFKKLNFNEKLAESTINKIIEGDNSKYLFIEPRSTVRVNKNSDNIIAHTMLDSIDAISDLKKVYEKEGLDGLRDYNLLAVAYIERDRDIFGNPEIYQGVKHTSYRILVIQRCNIYEQILTLNSDVLKNKDVPEAIEDRARVLNWVYTLGILQVIAFIEMLIVITLTFNAYIINNKYYS